MRFPTEIRAGIRIATGLLVLGMLAGCATYSSKLEDLRPELADGDFEGALKTVEEETGSKDRLLYFLERGLIFHYSDRYRESNEAFAAAERLAEDLYTKSISEGALSLFSNDNAISYRARPYELAMVPFYKGLNYAYLRERNSAQVEARRASLQVARYVDTTLDGLREEDRSELEQIRNQAFLQYFSGMLYDWDGEINDAFIAYRNAAVAYQQTHRLLDTEIPVSLALDLARVSRRLGFVSELEPLLKSCPDVFEANKPESGWTTLQQWAETASWRPGHGEVVLFLETGFVPMKTQLRFDFPIFSGEAYSDPAYWSWQILAGMGNMQALVAGNKIEYWVSVAAPELKDGEPGPVIGARVSAGTAAGHAVSARAENLARQARITFDAEKPSIFFKTILRGLTKYLASRGAKEAGGDWAGIIANIFGAVTESADTRCWLTLPEHVHLVRLTVPAGVHDLEVEILGPDGQVMDTRTIEGVVVVAGDWTILSRRVF